MPRWRQRRSERARGLICLTGRRSSGGGGRFGATTCAARVVFSHVNYCQRLAPNLAYPPEDRLPTTDFEPLARSKCRRRRRGAPPRRRHARGGGRFPVLLPLRTRNRLWFGPTKRFRVVRYMANLRSAQHVCIFDTDIDVFENRTMLTIVGVFGDLRRCTGLQHDARTRSSREITVGDASRGSVVANYM